MNAVPDPRQHLLTLLEQLPAWLEHRWASPLQAAHLRQEPQLAINVDLAGEQIRLHHGLAPAEQHLLLVECRIGAVPRRGQVRTKALTALLDQNFRLSSARSCAFAINPALGELVYMSPCALMENTAESLAELIRSSLSTANAVRATLTGIGTQ